MVYITITFRNGGFAFPDGLNFSACKHNARNEFFQQFEFITRLPVPYVERFAESFP
jgi:hypothetical protein